MTTRTQDASYLTQLKASQNQAYFFNRQVANGYPSTNPQSGVYDASKLGDLTVGIITPIQRLPGPIVIPPVPACSCSAELPNSIQRN
jgi:hypothetical protein